MPEVKATCDFLCIKTRIDVKDNGKIHSKMLEIERG